MMGTLVSIVPLSEPLVEKEDEDGPYTQRFILDDGTNDMAQFLASDHMTNAVQIGMTIDCVAHVLRKHNNNNKNNNKQQQQQQQQQHDDDDQETVTYTLPVIRTIIIMTDTEQALSLRSMEILHQRQCQGPSPFRISATRDGTDPTISATKKSVPSSLTWHDINNIIQAEAEVGVKIEELQEMFVIEKDELEGMIQELQMQGLIYQSKNGAYMPL